MQKKKDGADYMANMFFFIHEIFIHSMVQNNPMANHNHNHNIQLVQPDKVTISPC